MCQIQEGFSALGESSGQNEREEGKPVTWQLGHMPERTLSLVLFFVGEKNIEMFWFHPSFLKISGTYTVERERENLDWFVFGEDVKLW